MTNEQTNKQRINKNKKFHVTEPFSKGLYNSLHLQMKFLRHLLGITKLDKEKNQFIGKKNRNTEYSNGNKTIPEKVATALTEDGHKQTTKTSITI